MPQMAPLMWLPLLILNLTMLFLIISFIYFCISLQSVIDYQMPHPQQSKYLNDNKMNLKENKLFLNKIKWHYQF